MGLIEILLIIFSALFVISVFSYYIYRKIKKLPTGECASCQKSSEKLIKEYRKRYGK